MDKRLYIMVSFVLFFSNCASGGRGMSYTKPTKNDDLLKLNFEREKSNSNLPKAPLTDDRKCCYRSDLGMSKQDSEVIRNNVDAKPKSMEIKKLTDFVPPLLLNIVTDEFGVRRRHPVNGGRNNVHTGIDLRAEIGTPVYAVQKGTVIGVFRQRHYGLGVELKHDGGFKSRYCHLSKIIVQNGQNVKKGEKIALSGNSGTVTGAHLHFELWRNERAVDPSHYIGFNTD